MSGIDYDNDHYYTLPFLLSANILCYPFSRGAFSPYCKLGYGCFCTRLRLRDHELSGKYFFGCSNSGGGIAIRIDENYLFIEYLRSNIHGDDLIAGFNVDLYKVGYTIVL